MASWVDIANLAGALIGTETRITDPLDDKALARSLRAVWDLERRSAIRDGAWNCFVQRHRLPSLTAAPAHGFAYQYQLPANWLRVLEVQVGGVQLIAYQVEAGKIVTDSSGPLDTRCLIDDIEPANWDDAFAHAFAHRLALAVGEKIAGSAFAAAKVQQGYDDAIAAAKRVDASENPVLDNEESDWILARDYPAPWSLSR